MITRLLALLATVLASSAAQAGPQDEILVLYEEFYQAQNAHDLERVRELMLASDDFLWVSDGKSIWGADAALERMAMFQKAAVWQVVPDLVRAHSVEVDEHSAFLHLPLVLRIGPNDAQNDLPFLVSVLGVETRDGWRIAALFTTTPKL